MSFFTTYQELTGAVAKIPVSYCKTIVNRAVEDIYRKNLWSFQLFEGNWVSPNLINTGTVTVTQGLNTITFDAAASAALVAANGIGPFPTPLTQRQFRIGEGTIYSITAVDVSTPAAVIITLDRPYTDSSGSALGYMIYQIYYPAPMQDFKTWIGIRDIINFNNLGTKLTRKEIDYRDPQRTIFYLPTECVYYRTDPVTTSSTYRYPTFELWGGILYQITYQLYGIRKGLPLVNDDDELPVAIGEDCVLALSRMYAYEWAEANKGDMLRNSGPNYQFLMGEAAAVYKKLYKEYRMQDREAVDNWFEILRHRGVYPEGDGYYNAIGATASPGAPW